MDDNSQDYWLSQHGCSTPHRLFLLTGRLSATVGRWLVLLQLDGKWLPVGMGPDPPGNLARVRLCDGKFCRLFQGAQEESALQSSQRGDWKGLCSTTACLLCGASVGHLDGDRCFPCLEKAKTASPSGCFLASVGQAGLKAEHANTAFPISQEPGQHLQAPLLSSVAALEVACLFLAFSHSQNRCPRPTNER